MLKDRSPRPGPEQSGAPDAPPSWSLLSDSFGSAELRAVFEDRNLVGKWLHAEVALAEAEADVGLIPRSAAQAIRNAARADAIDIAALRSEIARTSHPLVPLVRALQQACGEDAAQYVHWGATTQDITDTATILLVRDALELLEGRAVALREKLLELASTHRDLVVVGRTHGQHAGPITLGFKLAVMADELGRHLDRLSELRPRLLVGQLGGASGSLASLGQVGLEVQQGFMGRLGLGVPPIPWHTSRDVLAETIGTLAMLTATAGKLANEVRVLQATEIDELREPHPDGTVGSSTMPHKRNPMVAESVVAIAKLARQTVPLALDAMVQEHERDMTLWGVEWEVTRNTFVLAGGAIERCTWILDNLTVNEEAIARNVAMVGGMLMSEAVMMGLAPHLGRQRAYDLVRRVCIEAVNGGPAAEDALRASKTVKGAVSADELERLLDPAAYTGLCSAFVDQVLAATGRAADGSACDSTNRR